MKYSWLVIFLFLSACSMKQLATVEHVDVNRYMGRWYEIASFPQSFQKGCECTVAEYSLNEDGTVKVKNSCNRNGGRDTSTGKAKVVDKTSNAKLKVTFFWPFSGKYWIIDLAEDYSYAVVGHPNRKYLWILSRTPQMDKQLYNEIVSRAEAKGFDVSKLNITKQDCWD